MKSEAQAVQHVPAIGQPLRRKEDARLIAGHGRFSDDFNLDGQAFAAIVRSPHPHARIVSIDLSAARAMPGVLGVFAARIVAPTGFARSSTARFRQPSTT